MELLLGLLIAATATVCIAAGRLLNRIRNDAVGKVFLVLGGFFIALSFPLLGGHIFWVGPAAVVGGLAIGNRYIRKRGLRD